MALYHFNAKVLQMSKGQSAVHTAAYNARCQLHDERENRDTKDYGYKGKTEFSGIFAPKDAPAWAHDRGQLWNRATAAERQANGQPARNVEFALPHELDAEQRRRLVTDFCRETFARRGMIADVNIHEPHAGNDARNYHVHCLLTMRRLEGEHFAKTKEREWNKTEQLAEWKDKWAQMGARALERAGFQQEADRFRHGYKQYPEQQKEALARGDHEWVEHCDREAQIHKGAAVSAMEQKNDPRLADNEIARESKAIDDRNAARAEIKEAEKELAAAQAEQEKTAAAVPAWQKRNATQTEKDISDMMNTAAHGGKSLSAALQEAEIRLVRVDAAGIVAKDAQYLREFQKEKAQGDPDARLRRSVVQEGELVALNKWGDVHRLNPLFLELNKLDFAATGGNTPNLSATLDLIAAERKQERADFWQRRPMSDFEKHLTELHDRAAFRDGRPLRDMLYKEGILLARVDKEGIGMKDADYRRNFENELLAGKKDAEQRTSKIQEGELVAVTKSGTVLRLNPKFVDRDALDRANQSSGFKTATLSESLQHFADARQQHKADRQAAQHASYEGNEAQRQQRSFAHNIKQGIKDAVGGGRNDTGIKGVDSKGFITNLGGFLESLFGMKAKPPPMTPAQKQQAQQRALDALEAIADSFERGDRLKAGDVANLTHEQRLNLHRLGDKYLRTMIDELDQHRKDERERSYGRER